MTKRGLKSILSLLMTFVSAVGLSATGYAAEPESEVTFADNRMIVFSPSGGYTDENLFFAFRDVMPGDQRIEEISIENESDDFEAIKVYLRAERHNRETNPLNEEVLDEVTEDERRDESIGEYIDDFLSHVELDLWNGSTLIYDDQPDNEGTLSENVYLGTIRKGETIELRAELTVPIELGNEYMGRIGEVDWVFTFEGVNEKGTTPSGGQTGAPSSPTGTKTKVLSPSALIQTGQLRWPVLALGGLGLLLTMYGILMIRKKRKAEHE